MTYGLYLRNYATFFLNFFTQYSSPRIPQSNKVSFKISTSPMYGFLQPLHERIHGCSRDACRIFFHSFWRVDFRDSTVRWDLTQEFASSTDHTQKSIGLRSGLEGGHSSLEMKSGNSDRNHAWLTLAMCAGTPSRCKVQRSFLNLERPNGFTESSKFSALCCSLLILALRGTKTSFIQNSDVTPTHTMTESGFWGLSAYLISTGKEMTLGDKILSFFFF